MYSITNQLFPDRSIFNHSEGQTILKKTLKCEKSILKNIYIDLV